VAEWWSIEVLHGEVSAFRWQEQHDSALIEAALTNGVRDGTWHADRWGVVFEVLFDTEDRWEAFRGLPVVRAALDAVPDPVNGLLIYRGRGGGAGTREPRRPKPAPSSAAVSLPGPADEPYLDLAAVSAPSVRPTTAGALERRRIHAVPGLAEMTLTDTVPVLRPSARGTEELTAIGRSLTGRECLKTVPSAGTAVRDVLASDQDGRRRRARRDVLSCHADPYAMLKIAGLLPRHAEMSTWLICIIICQLA
jgi:hypothetical protein